MAGLASVGLYVPRYFVAGADYPRSPGPGVEEVAIPGFDEDEVTMAVVAGEKALQGAPGRRVDRLTFASAGTRAGARIVAHEHTKQYLSTEFFVDWEGRTYQPLPAKALPTQTFYTKGTMTFGSEQVEYGHLGQAHTDGDIYVLFPDSNVLVAGGNLIRKVLFPAEILPIVTVLAGLVHFCLGLPILAAFLIYYQVPIVASDLLWFPVIVIVQLVLTLGLALLLSVLTVHFRDVRDLLQNLLIVWFFATPIIYPLWNAPERWRRVLELNPFTHIAVAYQEVLFRPGPFTGWGRLLSVGGVSVVILAFGYFVFDRLRDTLAEEV